MTKKQIKSVSDLTPDTRNPNKGTVRGTAMIEDSLRNYGAGRSILVDKEGNVLAGNKTLLAANELGLSVKVVETDGTELVVVQRTDLDIDTPKGRQLTIADNRASEVSLDWDADVLQALQADNVDLSPFFNDGELAHLLDTGEDLDYDAMWQGMPEFEQQDKTAWKTLNVHFENEADLMAFAELVQQSLTVQTKSIWYPKHEKENLKNMRWESEVSES